MTTVPTLVVNFYAGPSTGKSTMCAHTFAELKWRGINCEMALEFAKEKVWEGSLDVLDDQLYIFGKQYHSIHRLLGKVDIILTDSPIPLSLVYGHKLPQEFKALVLHQAQSLNNLNIFLTRVKKFNPAGRVQTYEESLEKDQQIRQMLDENNLRYVVLPAERDTVKDVLHFIDMAYDTMRKRTDRTFYPPEENQYGWKDLFPNTV